MKFLLTKTEIKVYFKHMKHICEITNVIILNLHPYIVKKPMKARIKEIVQGVVF